ncbi:MAG: ACR3 family arsenite efflux transporter [Anaerolineaceae bacterium]|nr:ACR3 family arsenite efflux transporter [Anaerolineaceae bacterium]
MNKFEKYLALWVALCMGLGILLSVIVPGIGEAIDSWQVYGISIPIGICLFLMMYPALLNVQLGELKKLKNNPLPIVLTLVSNWLIAPLVTALLANLFLKDHPQLMVAMILLGSSPCTAMVLVWGKLAGGNQEQNVVNTSLNTITIMFLYVPVVSLLTGLQNIPIDRWLLVISAVVFIGIPLGLGILSKQILTRWKGQEWFDGQYKSSVGKVSTGALLMTLVVLFSLNGQVLLQNFKLLPLISIPLLLGFVIVVGYNLVVTRLFGLQYREAITAVLIGSSSHFEIAIATAVTLYGVGSMAALGTTMGLFWEVPIMLGLVALGKLLRDRNFWSPASKRYEEEISDVTA